MNCQMILPQSGKLSAMGGGIKLTREKDEQDLSTIVREMHRKRIVSGED
jgi:hypothetical protein